MDRLQINGCLDKCCWQCERSSEHYTGNVLLESDTIIYIQRKHFLLQDLIDGRQHNPISGCLSANMVQRHVPTREVASLQSYVHGFWSLVDTVHLITPSTVCVMSDSHLLRAVDSLADVLRRDPTLRRRGSVLAPHFHWATSCRNERGTLPAAGLFHEIQPTRP